MEKRKRLSMQQFLRKAALSWTSLLALVLLVALSTSPICQGSLVQKRSVSRQPYQFVQNWDADASHVIRKRETIEAPAPTPSINNSSTNGTSSKIRGSVVPLNDSHNQLLVFWAGEDVIVCLAKDVSNNSSSALWISRDYGGTFSNATSLLIPSGDESSVVAGVKPVLNGFFNNPANNGHFALSDVHNKIIFTTKNYGAEFSASKVEFVPDEVLFDPHSDVNIVAYETSTSNKQMWVSIDFGKTWTKVQEHVKALSWDESVVPAQLYLQREEPSTTRGEGGSRSVILKSDSLFLDAKSTEVVITGVEEFEIKDDFMFATKQKDNETYDLLISYKKSNFRSAIFPANQITRHFFIADVSTDGQIFVCVVQNNSVANLFIGSFPMTNPEDNPTFSLSLERILYFKENVTWSESWLNEMGSEPFVDLHHVEGLRGVYIASQLKPSTVKNGKFSMNEVTSLITYDNGGEWKVLNPPEFEHDGRPIYCQYKSGGNGNCSLQISQRLNELYPRTRAVPILTKKSAVGLVLATGTVNTTLKGHLGVYLSTDGAFTWRQILQGNYVYAFGDHGGIIVATKMYKIGDDTNELLYSIDEGDTWGSYTFYEEKVRIMGLMTEPGENTTVFFIFGSVPAKQDKSSSSSSSPSPKHTWVLIKVDFKDVFERSCTKDDYKLWSPWDNNTQRECLLGRKEIYERRIPTHKCYNGKDYVRPVTKKICACGRSDFECDFGYVVDRHSPEKNCIKDNSETSQGVKPEWCRPSDLFYNKTKGYRKIPGDSCDEGTWTLKYIPEQLPCGVKNESEFLLVAKRDSVIRIDMNHFDRVETLPLTRVQAVIAVDFNLKNNCIFWSDVQRKAIMMLHLDGKSSPETLVSNEIASVEGLAFDWMANNLYFSDGTGSKIEVVRVDHTLKRMRKRLLSRPDVEKPRGIAVHPEKGFIFWTDWSTLNPSIGRAHLDGSNVKKIVENDVTKPQSLTLKWPNGITIDYQRNRLFWVDANLDRMITTDLNGENLQIVYEKNPKISHPFAVGVYKNSIYWDDWTTRGIYTATLDQLHAENYTANPDSVFSIKTNLPRLMDLKTYGIGMQGGSNLCSSEATSNCSHICFATPNETVSCLCPDGFIMQNDSCVCPDGKKPTDTGACVSKCEDGRTFQCRTHKDFCIAIEWVCDGDDDCKDNSDEEACDLQPCQDPAEFKCAKSGRCIPQSFVCDYDHDCGPGDTSDEENCKGKNPCDPLKHFECGNGRCVLKSWRCDDDDDCLDGTDELNCTNEGKNMTFSCLQSEWKCPNEDKCLSPDWLCDFDNDCAHGADELNCTSKVCPDWKFGCNETGHCIMKTWECDGDRDCPDGSDEHEGCPVPTGTSSPPEDPFAHGNCSQLSQMFECLGSRECIPIYWKCDKVKDCADGSDELGCEDRSSEKSPASTVTLEPEHDRCDSDHYRCNDGTCISMNSVCDNFPDCSGRDDETNCHNGTGGGCPQNMRRCGDSRACVFQEKFCDGRPDCPSNDADEKDCSYPAHIVRCNSGNFMCDDDMCMPLFKKCNGRQDCYDGSDEDESACKHFQPVHQVEGISATEVDSTWFDIDWWLPGHPSGKKLKFIPSVCELESGHCRNVTEVSSRNYTFEGLSPFKKYSVTVYVKDGSKIHPPYVYVNVTTSEAQADRPFGLQVTQNSTEDLIITWKKPHTLNGKLMGYKVYFQPPIPPMGMDTMEEKLVISNKQSDPVFLAGENYTFWVRAKNAYGDGKASELVHYVYNGEVALISLLSVKALTEHSVTFSWEAANSNVDSYAILLETDNSESSYTFRNRTETSKKLIDFKRLSAGSRYRVTVIPKRNGMHGIHRTLAFTTKGSPFPKVEGLRLVSAQSGNVKISWRALKIPGDFIYGIYFGKTVQELAEKRARILTSLTQTEASQLEACENYLFDIGVVTDNNGMGPLTERPLQVLTKMNPQSPPKSVKVEPSEDGQVARIKVSWKAPCDAMDKAIGYNITVMELTQNKIYGVSNVSHSIQNTLHHYFNLQYGGSYQLTVSTSVDGGKPSSPVLFDGPAIPFPEKVIVCSECNPLAIYWIQPPLPKLVTGKGEESYVVYLSTDKEFTNPTRYETKVNSFKFSDMIDNNIYYAAVSVKDHDGLESPRSSPVMVQHSNGASPLVVIPGSSALAITITVVVIIVLLVAVLTVFVVRHKRLQTSFLNFASSHYSSNSGAATFQHNIEEQDSPVIRGFSDDEPLLVA